MALLHPTKTTPRFCLQKKRKKKVDYLTFNTKALKVSIYMCFLSLILMFSKIWLFESLMASGRDSGLRKFKNRRNKILAESFDISI